MWDTHRSGLEMLVGEAPLVPVVLVVDQILLHDLVVLVEEQVADGAGGCVLQVVHWNQREEVGQAGKPRAAAPGPPPRRQKLDLPPGKDHA